MQTTRVTFPDGSLSGEGEVLVVDRDRSIVIVDATPFHPVDHTWPDQPGDIGALTVDHLRLRVIDAVMAAISDDGDLAVGADIPVKRGAEGWTWLVAHCIEGDIPTAIRAGTQVSLQVEAERRAALSRGHTACHLASLALDAAVSDLWRKPIGADPLGNPDFEGRANQSSRIHPDGSVDEYRLGKSLRKAGFNSDDLTASLSEREAAMNAQLAAWLTAGGSSRIDATGDGIVDRRTWHCALADGDVRFACGGTHVQALSELSAITVALELSEPQLLVLTTTVTPA